MNTSIELPPDPARLIEGLRDTGYTFNTALADIVDNSVDAEATIVAIEINMDAEGEVIVTVADNGYGMDKKTLENGMTYGAKGKVDPKRLGKFGLGLKTASTAFCRRLSVITRDSVDAEIIKATWDLDHVVNKSKWELLLSDVNKFEREILDKVASGSSGTLVVWESVDRLLKNYADPTGGHARKALKRNIDDFRRHASMIYQRFLDESDSRARYIKMTLNGEVIPPWDPFCIKEEKTECVAKNAVKVKLPNGSNTFFEVKAYILPRKEFFSSEEAWKEARLSNNMQGIYIYRENRLILPADWLGMFRQEPHFTLIRVELSFNHELDEAFQVDIKKSRIILNDVLYEYVMDQFLPAPRNAANERYRKGHRKNIMDKSNGAHDGSNKSISSKEKELRRSEVTIIDKDTGEAEIKNKLGIVRLRLKIYESSENGGVFVEPVESIEDGLLWEPAIIDENHAVRINTGHPYYHKVYVPNLSSDVTVQGMDALLWAIAEAELGTINNKTKEHFEELRFEVSRLLRKLVEDLPEPEMDI